MSFSVRRLRTSASDGLLQRPQMLWFAYVGIALVVLSLFYLIISDRRASTVLPAFTDRPYFSDDSGMASRVNYAQPALEAMGEPSLWKMSAVGQDAAYRFLCISSATGGAFAVRITRTDRGAELRMVDLAESTGSQSHDVRQDKKISLSSTQWTDVDSLAARAGFWAIPSQDDRVISDGSAFIMEGVRGSAYHGVHRQSPPPGPYRHLCHYLLALSGPRRPELVDDREPLAVGLGRFVLVKTRNLALALRFQEHTQIGQGGSDYNGATFEWFLQSDGSGDFSRDNVTGGMGEVVGNPDERWDKVVIECGPLTLTWAQCYSDCDYVSVQRAACRIDPFDVVMIAASEWSKRADVEIDDKYLIWSVGDRTRPDP